MFATFTFADTTFACSELETIQKAGMYVVKKKKKIYTIFGRQFHLTEKEYQAYLAQKKAYENKVKYDDIKEVVTDYKLNKINLDDIIEKPVFSINKLEIPLTDYKEDYQLLDSAIKRLVEINRQKEFKRAQQLEKQRQEAIYKAELLEKHRPQNIIDDELIIEMLLLSTF
jgi:hypothetical protein